MVLLRTHSEQEIADLPWKYQAVWEEESPQNRAGEIGRYPVFMNGMNARSNIGSDMTSVQLTDCETLMYLCPAQRDPDPRWKWRSRVHEPTQGSSRVYALRLMYY